MQHASWLFIAVISIRQTSEKQPIYNWVVVMEILPTYIRIIFTNYDIITYFLNLASCSEHFIRIKHRILATVNMNKKFNYDSLYAFKITLFKWWSDWWNRIYILSSGSGWIDRIYLANINPIVSSSCQYHGNKIRNIKQFARPIVVDCCMSCQ
jgi:hypothetical protein